MSMDKEKVTAKLLGTFLIIIGLACGLGVPIFIIPHFIVWYSKVFLIIDGIFLSEGIFCAFTGIKIILGKHLI